MLMGKSFRLEILTPERQFLNSEVQSLVVEACDGQLGVLSGHRPMVVPLSEGTLRLKLNGETKEAFHSAGFMEVRPDEVLIFAQACEWPEEIDEKRAKEALEKAQEQLRQKQSLLEYRHSQMSIARAMQRLRLSSRKRDPSQ